MWRWAASTAAVAAAAIAGCGGESLAGCPPPRSAVQSPQTQIPLPAGTERAPRVVGSESGRHEGELRRHAHGASFLPAAPFEPGERVCVDGRFSFTVAGVPAHDGFNTAPPERLERGDGAVQRFRSRPDLTASTVTILRREPGRARGRIMIAPKGGRGLDGPMIVDDRGEPIWLHPMKGLTQVMDFRVQEYRGQPVLTWWEGRIGYGQGRGEGVIVDDRYREIARIRAANGYTTDMHELTLTDRGTALFTVYNPVPWDLSPVGGSEDGIAIDGVVQEVDIATGLVVSEWHSLDHIPITESYYTVPKADRRPWDYLHLNSISVDRDGDLILSARHTFAVYKVDRETGAVIWRLGGKESDFEMGPGTRFAWQHDARRGPDGSITILDNAHTTSAPEPAQALTDGPGEERSRAIALELDAAEGTARLARSVPEPRGGLSQHQAGAHMLPNGNLFVGWGALPYFSEFAPDGRLLLDARLTEHNSSYRAYRAPWTGRPATPPRAVRYGGAVFASWNGATEVARWEVRAGGRRVGAARRSGFETRIPVSTRAAPLTVRALDARGRVLGTSEPIP